MFLQHIFLLFSFYIVVGDLRYYICACTVSAFTFSTLTLHVYALNLVAVMVLCEPRPLDLSMRDSSPLYPLRKGTSILGQQWDGAH